VPANVGSHRLLEDPFSERCSRRLSRTTPDSTDYDEYTGAWTAPVLQHCTSTDFNGRFMNKSVSKSIVTIAAALAVASVLVAMLIGGRHRSNSDPLTMEYPETGYPALVRNHPTSHHDIQRVTHHPTNGPALFDLAYENTIHPDEDLLMPDGQLPNYPSTESGPSLIAEPDPSYPPLEQQPEGRLPKPQAPPTQTWPTPPAQQPPTLQPTNPTPSQPQTTRPQLTQPQPTQPAPQVIQPQVPRQTVSPTRDSGGRFDPNQGPAPDEDLLFPNGSSANDFPTVPTPRAVDPPANPPNRQPTPNRILPEPIVTPQPGSGFPTTPENVSPIEVIPERPRTVVPDRVAPPAHEPRTLPNALAPHSTGSSSPKSDYSGPDPHLEVFSKTIFPSAKECRTCHEEIYDEWASSSHAYASISPMFQKFEQTINALAKGTVGYFCMRCHAPVATTLNHERHLSIYDSIPSATEGVTCVACHRVKEEYGKVNGERRVEMGGINDPVYGAGFGEGLAEVLSRKDHYKVKTGDHEKGPGQQIHNRVIHFEQLSSSHFCVSCHQVAVYPGIALEVVWAQYRASPAHKQGIECQECHMGQEPGVAQGYTTGPVAVVNGKEISPHRKHSNHMFYGPGYSIAHPGTFPKNPDADEWKMEEWLQFDYRAGWGTEEFEELLEQGKVQAHFPKVWENSDDRMDAREIVDANLEKLEAKRHMRHRLMENGSRVEGPIFNRRPRLNKPLNFHYVVQNLNSGHNMPSGSLGAQPQLWLNVVLTGPGGQHLWESGYVDRNGDIADMHSLEVAAGRIRPDQQLFNLQTKFLITHVKGTDREMYLPVPTDLDPLPFLRPSGFPITVMNHPPFIRMEGHSLPALGSRNAKYKVPANLIRAPGNYRLSVRMRSRAEPIYFMRYCKATPEMERNMNYWMLDYHEDHFDFFVSP
jgi:DNA-directed RNA polymerase subunit RPC12/RpoP